MASLKTYESLLRNPQPDLLSPTASLHYITTAFSVSGNTQVAAHLRRLVQSEFTSRSDRPLNSVQAGNTLVLESETEIEFAEGGGQFLPKIDSSFLSECKVLFALVHVVEFRDGLVEQIRLYWDQSTLLKQIGTIGRTGANWPVVVGKDQIKVITTALKELPEARSSNGRPTTPVKAAPSSIASSDTSSHTNANGRVYKDPHASLDLFSPSKEYERPIVSKNTGGYRPPTRDLTDIVGAPDEPRPIPVTPPKKRSDSSSTVNRPKHLTHGSQFQFGDGEDVEETPIHRRSKKHDASFEFGDGEDAVPAPPTTIRKNEKHAPSFELGQGADEPESPIRSVIGRSNKPTAKPDFLFGDSPKEDPLDRPLPKRNAKHNSQWDFEHFTTPAKTVIRHRPADELHFRLSDHDENEDNSPIQLNRQPPKRSNNETHFSLADDSDDDTPRNKVKASFAGGRVGHSVLGDATNTPIRKHNPSTATNFDFTDSSPAPSKSNKPLPRDKEEVVNSILKPHYDLYTENSPAAAGDDKPRNGGRSARNNQEQRHWGFGEEVQGSPVQVKKTQGRTNGRTQQTGGDFWDF